MAQMKYRKKPVVIDAVQFTGDNLDEIKAFAGKNLVGETCVGNKVYDVTIRTYEGIGVMSAYPGDWIIKGVHGEFYPCAPDIFEETYELAYEKMDIDKIIEEYKKKHTDITDLFYADDIILCRAQVLMEFSDHNVRWNIPLETCPSNFSPDVLNFIFDYIYNDYQRSHTQEEEEHNNATNKTTDNK